MSTDYTPDATIVSNQEPVALIALDLWGDSMEGSLRVAAVVGVELPAPGRALDAPGGWRLLRAEPTVWWLRGPLHALPARLASAGAALGDDGAAIDITGAFERLRIAGPRWRPALMIGGVFDAEAPAFADGCTAATLLHHASVRYDVIGDGAEIYVSPSYAYDLRHHLHAAAARVDAMEA